MNLRQDIDNEIFHLIGDVADELGREAYVVGGYVRDIFLNDALPILILSQSVVASNWRKKCRKD